MSTSTDLIPGRPRYDEQVMKAAARLWGDADLAQARGQLPALDRYLRATAYGTPGQVMALLEEAAAGVPGALGAYLEATAAARDARHQRRWRVQCGWVTDAADLINHDPGGEQA